MAKKMIITLRVNVEGLKSTWKEYRREYMLKVLELCGFDDDFIDDISDGLWSLRRRIIGKKIKIGKGK